MISFLVNEAHAIRAAMQDDKLSLAGGVQIEAFPAGVTLENATDFDYEGGVFTLSEERRAERLRREQEQGEECQPHSIETRVQRLEEKTQTLDEINEALQLLLGPLRGYDLTM